MPNNPIPNIPIEKVSKMPLAYALMIVGGLLGVFVHKYFDNSTEVIKSYVSKSIADEKEKENLKKEALFWQGKYVGSLEKTKELQDKQDSTNRATLQKPNTELLNTIKKSRQYE